MLNLSRQKITFLFLFAASFVNLLVIADLQSSNWSPPVEWSPPVNLSPIGSNSIGVQATFDNEGRGIAVWSRFDGTDYIIQSSTRKLSGQWTAPVDVSLKGGDAFFPQVAIDNKGNAVVVFARKSNKNFIIQVATKSLDKAWSKPVDISRAGQAGEDALFPQVVIDHDNNVFAIWQKNNGIRNVIEFSAREKGKGNWSSPLILSSSTRSGLGDIKPQMAVNQYGNVFAVWTSNDKSTIQSAIRQADNTWTKVKDISSANTKIGNAQIAIDKRGNAVALWTRNDGSNMIVQAVSRPSSGKWTQPVNLSAPGQDALFPALSINDEGNAVAAWQRSDGVYSIIQAATKHGMRDWSTPIDLTLTGEDATSPQVVIGSSNAAVVVFKRSDGANFVIQASTTLCGNVWSEPFTLSLTGQDSVNPQVSIDDLGHALVVWQRSDGKTTIVQNSSKLILE